TACIWDATSGALKHKLLGHHFEVLLARFSPDSQRIATGTKRGSVRLWDANSGEIVAHLDIHRKAIRALAFSSDGRRLASACADGTVLLWDTDSGLPLGEPL